MKASCHYVVLHGTPCQLAGTSFMYVCALACRRIYSEHPELPMLHPRCVSYARMDRIYDHPLLTDPQLAGPHDQL